MSGRRAVRSAPLLPSTPSPPTYRPGHRVLILGAGIRGRIPGVLVDLAPLHQLVVVEEGVGAAGEGHAREVAATPARAALAPCRRKEGGDEYAGGGGSNGVGKESK